MDGRADAVARIPVLDRVEVVGWAWLHGLDYRLFSFSVVF